MHRGISRYPLIAVARTSTVKRAFEFRTVKTRVKCRSEDDVAKGKRVGDFLKAGNDRQAIILSDIKGPEL
jgi:hypothetical protein